MNTKINIKNKITGYNIPTVINIPINSKDIIIMCHGFGGDKDSPISKLIVQFMEKVKQK